jgi:hypothetical protein
MHELARVGARQLRVHEEVVADVGNVAIELTCALYEFVWRRCDSETAREVI